MGRPGTSTLVEAGPERFLIDAGSGAFERLVDRVLADSGTMALHGAE